MKRIMVLALSILFLLAGCSNQKSGSFGDASPTLQPKEMIVFAAASLSNALQEMQPIFERRNPGTKLVFSFGGSGTLRRQIENGAPADLFLTAEKKEMDQLLAGHLVEPGKTADTVTNELVAIVPASNSTFKQLSDLKDPRIGKIAIGEPETVPAGVYAKEAFEFSNLWDTLKPKLIYAKDVRQVLSYVETGNADVGIVYRTDALQSSKVNISYAFPKEAHQPIRYQAGVMQSAKSKSQALVFFEYLKGKEAVAVFQKYGFLPAAAK